MAFYRFCADFFRSVGKGSIANVLFVIGVLYVPAAGLIQEASAQTGPPPFTLQSRNVPGGIELLWPFSYYLTTLNVSRSPAWSPNQNIVRQGILFMDDTLTSGSFDFGIDVYVTPGIRYKYTLTVPGGPNNNQTSTASISVIYNPVCQFIGHCPTQSGDPPQYTINCSIPADFFDSKETIPPMASGQQTFSGIGTLFPSSLTVTLACLPGTVNLVSYGSCSGFSQRVDVSSCPPPKPPKPPVTTCSACLASGRMCVRSGAGFVCKGNAQ